MDSSDSGLLKIRRFAPKWRTGVAFDAWSFCACVGVQAAGAQIALTLIVRWSAVSADREGSGDPWISRS